MSGGAHCPQPVGCVAFVGGVFFCFLPFMSRCVVGVADSVRHGVTREFAIGAATVASPVSYDDALIAAGGVILLVLFV